MPIEEKFDYYREEVFKIISEGYGDFANISYAGKDPVIRSDAPVNTKWYYPHVDLFKKITTSLIATKREIAESGYTYESRAFMLKNIIPTEMFLGILFFGENMFYSGFFIADSITKMFSGRKTEANNCGIIGLARGILGYVSSRIKGQ